MKRTLFLPMVLLVTAGFVGGCGSNEDSQLNDSSIYNKGRYVYFVTPLRDFTSAERAETIIDAQEYLVAKLKETMPESDITTASSTELSKNSDMIERVIKDADEWFLNKRDELEEIGVDFKTVLVPSAFIIATGIKKTVSTGVGGGFDVTVGAVVIPTRVTRIDKITKETQTWTSLRISLIGLPTLQVGAGAGVDLGVTYRFGVGLIWNKLDKPEDFTGFAAGFSGSFNLGVGNAVKVGLLKRDSRSDTLGNPFALATWQSGAAMETEWHGFGGYVLPLSKYIKALALQEEIRIERDSDRSRYRDRDRDRDRDDERFSSRTGGSSRSRETFRY